MLRGSVQRRLGEPRLTRAGLPAACAGRASPNRYYLCKHFEHMLETIHEDYGQPGPGSNPLTRSGGVLYDLGGFGPLFKLEDLYVSCTRAKALLVAIVHGDRCREVILAAQAAAEGQR